MLIIISIIEELKKLTESELVTKRQLNKPDFADAYNNLGYTLRELGRLNNQASKKQKLKQISQMLTII